VPPATPHSLFRLDAMRPEREIREVLGFEGPIEYFDHHQSHAASSYYYSGFSDAALLTVDAVGEWATTTYGRAEGSRLELFEEVRFPDSLGLLYSAVTSYLGFDVNDAEYKVMGLAPHGEPRYVDQVRSLIIVQDDGQFRLDMRYFEFLGGALERHLRLNSRYRDRQSRRAPAAPRRWARRRKRNPPAWSAPRRS